MTSTRRMSRVVRSRLAGFILLPQPHPSRSRFQNRYRTRRRRGLGNGAGMAAPRKSISQSGEIPSSATPISVDDPVPPGPRTALPSSTNLGYHVGHDRYPSRRRCSAQAAYCTRCLSVPDSATQYQPLCRKSPAAHIPESTEAVGRDLDLSVLSCDGKDGEDSEGFTLHRRGGKHGPYV